MNETWAVSQERDKRKWKTKLWKTSERAMNKSINSLETIIREQKKRSDNIIIPNMEEKKKKKIYIFI